MSASIHVVGLRDLDGQFAKMAAIKKMCEDSGVSYPKEVVEYFDVDDDGSQPDEDISYYREQMEEIDLDPDCTDERTPWWEELDEEMVNGCIIDIAKLPPEVKRIKFYVSY